MGTQPAPPIVTNANGAGLSGKAFLYDDFTRYSSTADLFNNISEISGGPNPDYRNVTYTDGYGATMVELDRATLYNGHPTMKYNQPGGISAGPALWPGFHDGKTLSHMWLRAKIRFSPGFTTAGTNTNSANAYKLLGWGWTGYDGRGTVEITNTNEYEFGMMAQTGPVQTTNFAEASAGHVTNEWNDGAWYVYVVEYEITSTTTATARVWIAKDGQTPVLRATIKSFSTDGKPIPRVNSVRLGLNFNQTRAPAQNQALWYGQWEVVDGDQTPNPFGLSGY